MEEILVELLKKNNMTISTAESCTGGMIAATIINVSGASAVYNQGYITYANEAKENILGVSRETLDDFGAVSEETVREMAEGCARVANADVSVVTSGIAGPNGGTLEKPVGLVYIACYVKGSVKVEKNIFQGDRMKIRESAVARAIELAIDMIKQ